MPIFLCSAGQLAFSQEPFLKSVVFGFVAKVFKLIKVERLLDAMKADVAYDYVAAIGDWIGRTGAVGLPEAVEFVEAVAEVAESLKPIGFRRARNRDSPPWLLALRAKARAAADGESDGACAEEVRVTDPPRPRPDSYLHQELEGDGGSLVAPSAPGMLASFDSLMVFFALR